MIKPPNETTKHGNLAHSSGGLSSQAPWDNAPNHTKPGAHVNSSGPMGRSASPMPNPNLSHRFDVANARAGYDRTGVVAPGKGAISVDATSPLSHGSVQGSSVLRDTAKK